MLNHSSQDRDLSHQPDQQIDRIRQEAEALFRPKLKLVEISAPKTEAPIEQSARKPRILSAHPAPKSSEVTVTQEPKASTDPTSLARAHRHRLARARNAIVAQQQVLSARLGTLDTELRAIAAYEAAKAR